MSGLIKIPFLPTPDKVVKKIILLADLKPNEKLIDLGSGDARILLTAARLHDDIKCYGAEINSTLFNVSKKRIEKVGFTDRIKIFNLDLFRVDLRPFDVITLYLTPKALKTLQPRIARVLKEGKRVISHDFPLEKMKPVLVEKIPVGSRLHKLYLYSKDSL